MAGKMFIMLNVKQLYEYDVWFATESGHKKSHCILNANNKGSDQPPHPQVRDWVDRSVSNVARHTGDRFSQREAFNLFTCNLQVRFSYNMMFVGLFCEFVPRQ